MKPQKIYAEVVEQGALDQFASFMEQDWVLQGALLPDCHTGYSLPVGAVIACDGMVSPQAVGFDIGCGMCAVPLTCHASDVHRNAAQIFKSIYRSVPVGFNHNKCPVDWPEGEELDLTQATFGAFMKGGLNQLGTLGGGNHFIEVGVGPSGVWVIVHSGSRNLGHGVASRYMKMASPDGKAKDGPFGLRVDSQEGQDYITDLNFCLEFALANRKEIVSRVVREVAYYCGGEANWDGLINRNHNHAELKDGLWIHRKGATHAEAGMLGVIPGNMRDGSFIVRGLGNPESLCSSSHGAGRVMGRKAAERALTVEDFQRDMLEVVAKVDKDTLDESPRAYKDIFEVMRLQAGLVEVVEHVKPIINVKG